MPYELSAAWLTSVGAPETYREDAFASETHLQVDSTIDVWSLGCVLLEAIVWVTGGRDSLEDFRQQRIAETKGIEDNQSIGAFHDGYGEVSISLIQKKHTYKKAELFLDFGLCDSTA